MMDKNKADGKSRLLEYDFRLKNTAEKALAFAKEMGATNAEVALNNDKGLSVTARLGEVETVEFNQDKSMGITVYRGNRRGSASSSDISDEAVRKAVSHALDIAEVSDEDKCFGLADASLMPNDYPELSLYHPWSLSANEAIELAKVCEAKAIEFDKRIENSEGASISSHDFLRVYANTHGFIGSYQASRHSLSCVLIASDSKGMQRDYDYTTARDPLELLSAEELGTSAAEKTLARLNAQKLETCKAPVLFASDVSSSLLGALVSAVSGNNLYRRSSFLIDKRGKQVFAKGYDIFEQPHLLKGLGSAPYDSEGVLTRENVFVRDGVLESYVLGSYSARRLGLETTANSGGVHNLTISDDGLSFDELIVKMDKGLVVTELMGQGVNLVTGDYSRGASGFWVEGGKIQFSVDEITIAGNLAEMFQNIVAVGSDIDKRKATRCGSVLIESMTIAGE